MGKLTINDFSAGLQTFGSPRQLKGFQTFENLDNLKPGRLEKPLGEANKSNTDSVSYSAAEMAQGFGFISYRTEYDGTGTPVQTSTLWYLMFVRGGASVWAVRRYDASQAVGSGTWSNVLLQTAAGDWQSVGTIADISYYVYRGILRISDGLFTNSNVSKWYGHISRDVFGISVNTYGAFPDLVKPAQAEAFNEWALKDQELVAPTIIRMSDAFDSGGVINAVNEIGLFVYDVRHQYGTTPEAVERFDLWPDTVGENPFSPEDRWATTFVYDHVQESALSRDSGSGADIGVSGFEVINNDAETEFIMKQGDGTTDNLLNGDITALATTVNVDDGTSFKENSYIRIDQELMFIHTIAANALTVRRGSKGTAKEAHEDNREIYWSPRKQKARAVSIVVYTGASNASWNQRITAINLYWQPKGEVDWFLVGKYDTHNGFSDSPGAIFEPVDPQIPALPTNTTQPLIGGTNWGKWQKCPTGTDREGGLGTLTGSGAATWTDTAYFSATQAGDIAMATNVPAGDKNVAALFNMLETQRGIVSSLTANTLTFTGNIALGNRLGFRANDLWLTLVPDHATFLPRTDVVATWPMSFDGTKISTYQSLTGRFSAEKVLAMRWQSADVSDDGMAACFNVDTLDDSSQTVRERSRVYWTPPGMPDSFSILRSRDIGKDDGDEGVAVAFWNDAWYLMKDRNIYVYSKDMSVRLKYYPGIGCKFRHSFYKTPFGIVTCDDSQIALLGNEALELTLPWRKDYQALTLNNPVLGYSSITKELYFINDTSEDDLVLYKFSFDNKSWRKQTLEDNSVLSNLLLGDALEPLGVFNATGSTSRVKEFNTGVASTNNGVFKKRFDLGDPNLKKRISGIWATYKTDAMTVDTTADTNEGVNISETDIDVDDHTVFSVNQFIKIDSEIMLVTAVATAVVRPSGVITVIRAVAGSVAATHTSATSIYRGADDLTVGLYYDGRTTADESKDFSAVEGLVNMVIKPTTPSNEHKFVDVEVGCAGEDLVIEDISLDIDPKGKKLTNG